MSNDERLSTFWSFNRARDSHLIGIAELIWKGPYSWYGFQAANQLPETPNIAGVYLFCFDYQDGYILSGAGHTNSMKRRFSQHKRNYFSGKYNLLDAHAASRGERLTRWRGWEYAKTHQEELQANTDLIKQFANEMLTSYRIFVTPILDKRKRERLEFSIVHHVYASKQAWGDLLDGGMSLRGRFNYEVPIRAINQCDCQIYGLPREIEI